MRSAFALGWRLAWGQGRYGGAARLRTTLLAAASALATAVLLRAIRDALDTFWTPAYQPGYVDLAGPAALLVCAVIPALVLVGAAGRMAAESRERGLATLRLLGLSAARVRLVAAGELAVATLTGIAVGMAAADLLPGGGFGVVDVWPRRGSFSATGPTSQLVIAAAVLSAAVLPTLLRPRGGALAARTVRRAPSVRPPWWRALPLAGGLGLCLVAHAMYGAGDGGRADVPVLMFAAGTALTAVGVIVVVPLLVRLAAGALVRVGASRPAALLAGRRMLAQPAAAARVVATLVVALFLGTAAQATVAAQESLEDRWVGSGGGVQVLYVTDPAALDTLRREPGILGQLPGLKDVTRYGTASVCDRAGTECLPVLVGSCAALRQLTPGATGCVDGTPYRLVRALDGVPARAADDPLVRLGRDGLVLRRPWLTVPGPAQPGEAAVAYPAPTATLTVPFLPGERLDYLLLPPDTPQLAALGAAQEHTVRLVAPGGREARGHLEAHGIPFERRYVVAGDPARIGQLRTDLLDLTQLGVLLGLVAFAITFLDRVAQRRAEVVGLQLVGVPRRMLRAGHAWEMGTPLVLGAGLAIALGRLVGDLYLGLGWQGADAPAVPEFTTTALVTATLVGIVALTALSAVVSNPRMRPELIRTA